MHCIKLYYNTLQDELCRLLIRVDDMEGAVSLLKAVTQAKYVVYGDPSEEAATCHQLLGSIRLKQGQMELALKSLCKVSTTTNGARDVHMIQVASSSNRIKWSWRSYCVKWVLQRMARVMCTWYKLHQSETGSSGAGAEVTIRWVLQRMAHVMCSWYK